MKVRKEVFESLRLDLQEFAPQEFVAACWKITCVGDGYLTLSRNDKKNFQHLTCTETHKDHNANPPVLVTGYLWDHLNGGQNQVQDYIGEVYYFQIGNQRHASSSNYWDNIATTEHPNASV